MKETKINVSISLRKNINHGGWNGLMYRLFLNSDLLTERTWIWDSKTKIEEEILIDSDVLDSRQNQLILKQEYASPYISMSNSYKNHYFGINLNKKSDCLNSNLITPIKIEDLNKDEINFLSETDSYFSVDDKEYDFLNILLLPTSTQLLLEMTNINSDRINSITLTTYSDSQIAEFDIV